jgi:multiple sugar transport system permease protein
MTVSAADPASAAGATMGRSGPHRRSKAASNALARHQRRWGLLFAAPAVLGFGIFTIGPMLASLILSFTDVRIGTTPEPVGGQNYVDLFSDPLFVKSMSVTAYYALLTVPLSLLVAFLAALLLNQAGRARGFFRTAFYLPVLVPPVASAVLWLWIFNPDLGLLNTVLQGLRLPTLGWIYDEATAVPSLSLMAVWGFGNTALIFLAGLQGVPRDLYEAAECDGANPLRRVWHVTLPAISPIVLFNLITGLIAAFQVFDVAFVMTEGGPNDATYFYIYYLYTKAFTEGQLGIASAMAWILFLIIVLITLLIFRTARHWVFTEGSRS